ncbi:MAG: dipeptidase [Gammaproteobacteria bacterium]|nr:dipeptidase [Gammaproteobacteria bacterium]
MRQIPLLLIAAIVVAGCATTTSDPASRAQSIAKRYPIIDTHVDVPYRLEEKWDDVSRATEGGDFDYPRAVAGGLDAPFMSIYVPAAKEAEGGGFALANQLIDRVEAIVGRAPDKFALAYSTEQLLDNFERGLISLPMGMENGTPIEGKLDNLQHFHDRGIRYITLAHSGSNHISDSSYDDNRQWGGLSPFGEQVVNRMNDIGMMIDISHLTDDAAYDVLRISSAPVIASHSSARHFTPGWERNMDDDLIRALAAQGGVIHINYGSAFITEDAQQWYDRRTEAREAFMAGKGIEDSDHPVVKEWTSRYRELNPLPFANLEQVLDHFDHVVELVGIDHVGIGSDYDGVGDSLPTGLKDVASYPNLIAGLLQRGYSEDDIARILYRNTLRVWRAVEATAD